MTAAVFPAPEPRLAAIVDQMLAGSSLPYSNDGTIQLFVLVGGAGRLAEH